VKRGFTIVIEGCAKKGNGRAIPSWTFAGGKIAQPPPWQFDVDFNFPEKVPCPLNLKERKRGALKSRDTYPRR